MYFMRVRYRKLLILACFNMAVLCRFAQADIPIQTEQPPREIEVSADVWSWTAPDQVRITAVIEASGKTADEVLTQINKRSTDITASVKKLVSGKATILSRGIEIQPVSKDTAIQLNIAVRAKRYWGIETTALEQVGKIIDTVLSSGASSIAEVDYFVRDDNSAKIAAIEQATEKAKTKAQALASRLGVSVGPLLSAIVTEEPPGAVFREKQRQGENLYFYSDSDSHIFVTLRFEVVRD